MVVLGIEPGVSNTPVGSSFYAIIVLAPRPFASPPLPSSLLFLLSFATGLPLGLSAYTKFRSSWWPGFLFPLLPFFFFV